MSDKKGCVNDFKEILQKVADEEGLSEYIVVDKKTELSKSAAVGLINFVRLVGKKNDSEEELHLVIKSAPKEDQWRSLLDVRGAFIKEQHVYKNVLPIFRKFEQECAVNHVFDAYPKCYAMDDNEGHETLVFEDLTNIGYSLKTSDDQEMDERHMKIVLEEYARLHAISFAMKAKRPDVFNALLDKIDSNLLGDVIYKVDGPMLKLAVQTIVKHLQRKNKRAMAKAFLDFAETAPDRIIADMESFEDDCRVINHGDCWGNNFLFKYEDEKNEKPTGVKIIDWQCSWYTTPTIDLGFFIWACCKQSLYDDHLLHLQHYHDALRDHLIRFGMDVEAVFPYEELVGRWRKGIRFGAIMAIFIFKAMLTKPEEKLDYTNFNRSTVNQEESTEIFARINEYLKKCEFLIEFLYNNNLLR